MPTDLARFIAQLNNSKIRRGKNTEQDPALYQVIFGLIQALQANEAIQGRAAPTAHATTHYAPGSDPVDILQLGGYTGTTTDFLRADGTWQLNSGSGISQLTGDVQAGPGTGSVVSTISNNAITTVKVADAQITYVKIQDVSAPSLLLGRGSAAGSGDVQEIALDTTSMAMTGTILSALTSTGSGFPTYVTSVPTSTTVSTANTVVDVNGMSFTLSTGSWLVWGAAAISGSLQTYAAIYVTNTTNTIQAAGQSSIFVNNSNVGIPIGPFLLVVPSTQDYKMRFVTGQNGSIFLQNDTVNTSPVSFIAAVQVA